MLTKLLVIGGLALMAGGAGTAPEKNIVDTAAAAGSFNTLVKAVQAAGLWALSAGLAYNFKDDLELLEQGMVLYDALYSWAKFLQKEKHTQQPFENLLLDVLHKFLEKEIVVAVRVVRRIDVKTPVSVGRNN